MNMHSKPPQSNRKAAIDLIKQRIRDLYGDEPPRPAKQPTLVERFWQDHKDHHAPEQAWEQFYAGLTEQEKHQLWDDYHRINSSAGAIKQPSNTQQQRQVHAPVGLSNNSSHANTLSDGAADKTKKALKPDSLKDTKEKLLANLKSKQTSGASRTRSKAHHWKPLVISLTVMGIVVLAQYNTLILAFAKQYVSPGNTLQSPVIIDPSVDIEIGDESRIIIPKINVDVPVVFDLGTVNEEAIQNALEDGVVHYDGTANPGQAGNSVIVGHSSNNFLNAGKYKFAFVLLDRLEVNDTYIIHHKGIRYVYKVTNKKVVDPTDFSVVQPTAIPTSTLITCTPPGTSWRRLIIQSEQISPTPSAAQLDPANVPSEPVAQESEDAVVPGNSPSLWQRFTDWVF